MELSSGINPTFNNASLSCVGQHIFKFSLDFLAPAVVKLIDSVFHRMLASLGSEYLRAVRTYRETAILKLDVVMSFWSLLQVKLQRLQTRDCLHPGLFLTENCFVTAVLIDIDYC